MNSVMFADDTNLFLTNNDIKKLYADMNIELCKVNNWFKANKLSLNAEKTNYNLRANMSNTYKLPRIINKYSEYSILYRGPKVWNTFQKGFKGTDFQKKNSRIGFFKIPKNAARRNKWAKIISQFRRKGGNDNFVIKDTTLVCELHFKNEDIQFLSNIGRKSLKKEAFPSIFEFKKQVDVQKRCSPKKRKFIKNFDIKNVSKNEDNFKTNDRQLLFDFEVEKVCLCCVELQNKIDLLEKEKHEQKLFQKYAGIEHEQYINVYNFLNPRKNGENVNTTTQDYLKICTAWLKNGFTILHTSWLFKISKSTASRYLITWTNFLYFSLGSVPIWPSHEQVNKFMPESFKMTFPSTRCIIDCTELFCQKPSSLRHQSSLFSSYKHHVTYKGLLGISPSGTITFISQLYDGAISDKEIVVRSGFLNKELWNKNDSVMADRGFTNSDHLNTINVKLNIPSFLNGKLQLSKEDATESQTITSLRIHVERAIRKII
ncbi:uncharacterized protein LOC136091943 [Hydra vulgaris]|uniref:Uncharacterized protein LOC136091943 n=1 Tax=Hydra vulgaris TaxID=6087 RepID=A0ABM4DMF0_HYDVU